MSLKNHTTTSETLSISGARSIRKDRRIGISAALVPRPIIRVRQSAASATAKIVGVACFSLVLFLGVFSTGDTMSYFLDEQRLLGNTFTADPLSFSVAASSTAVTLDGSDPLIVAVMTPSPLSAPIQYSVTATTTAGDPALCAAIQLLGSAPFVYDAPLVSLATATSTQTGQWALTFSVAPGSTLISGTTCAVDLVYTGWDASAVTGEGYSDTERLPLSFTYVGTTAPTADTSAIDPNASSTPDIATSSPAIDPGASSSASSSIQVALVTGDTTYLSSASSTSTSDSSATTSAPTDSSIDPTPTDTTPTPTDPTPAPPSDVTPPVSTGDQATTQDTNSSQSPSNDSSTATTDTSGN